MEEVKKSVHARYFNKSNPHWSRNPEVNHLFLRSHQRFANDSLKNRGHIFLNEIYDMLGFDRHPAGQLVGWMDREGAFIDFQLSEGEGEGSILIDFNPDGVIYHLIEKKGG